MIAPEFVEEIYAAASAPERWLGILTRLASMCDAEGAVMFTSGPEGFRWIGTPGISDFVQEWIGSAWVERDSRGRRIFLQAERKFLTDLHAFTPAELEQEPFYRDFLRPRGLGWCAGTAITLRTGVTVVLSIEKALDKGPIAPSALRDLDEIHPHLVRAILLAGDTAGLRVSLAVEALDLAGLAAAVLRRDGSVAMANGDFYRCRPAITLTGKKIVLSSGPAQSILQKAISEVHGSSGIGSPRTIVIPRTAPGGPLLAHLIPFEPFRNDIFLGAAMMLVTTQFNGRLFPDEHLLTELFDLTPTEAKVVSLLINGSTVGDIARLQKVTINTIRVQLKSVFSKTGVHRQAQLVSLLARTTIDSRQASEGRENGNVTMD